MGKDYNLNDSALALLAASKKEEAVLLYEKAFLLKPEAAEIRKKLGQLRL